jgi:hypothetical protein
MGGENWFYSNSSFGRKKQEFTVKRLGRRGTRREEKEEKAPRMLPGSQGADRTDDADEDTIPSGNFIRMNFNI